MNLIVLVILLNMYTYLNTETNRELSKLLNEKGCDVFSGAWYWWAIEMEPDGLTWWQLSIKEPRKGKRIRELLDKKPFPAFTFEDVIRPENAKKWAGDGIHCYRTKDCIGECYKAKVKVDFGSSSGMAYKCRVCKRTFQKDDAVENFVYHTKRILHLYQSGKDWQTYIINHLKGETK